jgi:hypothetical protein
MKTSHVVVPKETLASVREALKLLLRAIDEQRPVALSLETQLPGARAALALLDEVER